MANRVQGVGIAGWAYLVTLFGGCILALGGVLGGIELAAMVGLAMLAASWAAEIAHAAARLAR